MLSQGQTFHRDGSLGFKTYMSMKALYLIRQIIRLLVEVKQASVLTRPSSKNKYLLRLCFQSEKDKIVSLHTGVPKFWV